MFSSQRKKKYMNSFHAISNLIHFKINKTLVKIHFLASFHGLTDAKWKKWHFKCVICFASESISLAKQRHNDNSKNNFLVLKVHRMAMQIFEVSHNYRGTECVCKTIIIIIPLWCKYEKKLDIHLSSNLHIFKVMFTLMQNAHIQSMHTHR